MSSHCLNDHISIVIHPKYNENSVHCQTWGRGWEEGIGKREEGIGKRCAKRKCLPLRGGGTRSVTERCAAQRAAARKRPSVHAVTQRQTFGAATPLRRSAPAPLKGSLPSQASGSTHRGKIRHCRQLSLTLTGENCKIYAESSMARLRLGNRSGLSFQIETP